MDGGGGGGINPQRKLIADAAIIKNQAGTSAAPHRSLGDVFIVSPEPTHTFNAF